MNHTGTQVIETRRLVLRPFTLADTTAVFVGWGSDLRVARHLSWEPHPDVAYTRELLQQQVDSYTRPDFYYWAITLAATGELLGCITAKPSKHGDWYEPAYWLGFRYWSGGYMTEALAAVCRYLFEQAGFAELICCHDKENPVSGRVMQKVGFIYSHDAQYERKDGTKRPCCCYLLGAQKRPTSTIGGTDDDKH